MTCCGMAQPNCLQMKTGPQMRDSLRKIVRQGSFPLQHQTNVQTAS